MEKTEFKRRLKNIIIINLALVFLAVILIILAKNGLAVPCIFNRITGFKCPGCGNTRAVMALIRFEFLKALNFNPVFPLEFFYIGWVYVISSINYMKGKRFSYQPPLKLMDITLLAVFLLWGVIRNF